LRHAAEQSRAGRGQVVAVVGEPGVGKSRLYYEFLQSHHAREFLVLESGSVSYGKATPFLPLADLLRSYFMINARDDVRRIRVKVTGGLLTVDEALKDAIPVALWLLDALPEDSPLLKLEPAERRRQTFAALKRILLREIEGRPLLLVFEDLHWIDNETQAFLDGFIDSVPATRILLAVNYRPEYRHGWANRTYYRQLRVDPLAAQSAEDLLTGLLGSDSSVASLRPLLIARTEGRPLFLEESVRMLVETGALAGERGAYRLVRAVDALQVPATVQAILAARIDRLEPEDKRLLQAAAVIGTHVPFAVLKAVAAVDEDSLRRGLARLQAAEFMYEARLFPELEFAFKHALTHEVAYGGVLQERRQTLHRGAVEAIERIYANRLAEQIERLAHHGVAGRVLPKALVYLKQAGAKAVGRSANQEALAYLEQARALLREMPESAETNAAELEILVAIGSAVIAVKGPQSVENEQLYVRALALVDRLNSEANRFPVLWNLWYVGFTRAQHADALRAASRLCDAARQSNDEIELLEAEHAMWPTLTAMGRPLQAVLHAEKGLAMYDPERHAAQRFVYGGHDPGVCGTYHLAMARWLAGAPDSALRDLTAGLRLAEKIAHPPTSVLVGYFGGWVRYQCGDIDGAMALFALADDTGRRSGNLRYVDFCEVVLRCGRGEMLGLEVLDRLRDALSALVWPSWQKAFCVCMLAERYALCGHLPQGIDLLRDARRYSAQTCMAPEVPRLEAELLARSGAPDLAEAQNRAREAISIAVQQQALSMELRAATTLARLLASTRKRGEARAALEPVYGRFTEGFGTADLKAARALLDGIGAA